MKDSAPTRGSRTRLRDGLRRLESSELLGRLRDRLKAPTYVDASEVPDNPEGPYRARLTVVPEKTPDGIELREREVVRGQVRTILEIRCVCGKRWLTPHREMVHVCPRCDRAVLLQLPDR